MEFPPLFLSLLLIFLVNIPFGFLNAKSKKFSFIWFLYIHLPVPLVIIIRYYFAIELNWITAPFLFTSFFLGQLLGRKIKLCCN